MPGFVVSADDADYDIQIQVRYAETADADELTTVLTKAYAKAFATVLTRLKEVESKP